MENTRKLCTNMNLPRYKCYDERLNILSLPPLALLSENLYKNRFLKIMSNGHHQLHSFIPEWQSGCRLHSAARLIKDSFFYYEPELQRGRTRFS